MIYLDTSVAMAHLFGEDLHPPDSFWNESLTSSRLLEYEVWTQINARRLSAAHGEIARTLLANIAFLEMTPVILSRALEPFPTPLRTLDALHLASLEFARGRGLAIELASYDKRMIAAAQAMKIPLATV